MTAPSEASQIKLTHDALILCLQSDITQAHSEAEVTLLIDSSLCPVWSLDHPWLPHNQRYSFLQSQENQFGWMRVVASKNAVILLALSMSKSEEFRFDIQTVYQRDDALCHVYYPDQTDQRLGLDWTDYWPQYLFLRARATCLVFPAFGGMNEDHKRA